MASQRDWTALAKEAATCPAPKKAQCRHAANWGLVRFLRAVALDVQSTQEHWGMALRRAAKGLTEVEFRVTDAEQAQKHVNGVGPSTAGLLNTFWAVCPPAPAGEDEAAPAAPKAASRKRRSDASMSGEAAGASPGKKRWVPKYKTANWALLVTLDKLKRQGARARALARTLLVCQPTRGHS